MKCRRLFATRCFPTAMMRLRVFSGAALVIWPLLFTKPASLPAADEGDVAERERIRKAFITRHCVICHGEERQSGEFRIDTARYELSERESRDRWNLVLDYVETEVMPPEEAPLSPAAAERQAFISALKSDMASVDRLAKVGGTLIRRMNRIEYLNTLSDLVGTTRIKLPPTFPEDSTDEEFDTIPAGLYLSPAHLNAYLDVAAEVADRLVPLPNPPQVRSVSEGENVGRDEARYWQRKGDPDAYYFTGVNTSGWSGALWDATFVAHLPGMYRVSLRVNAEAERGAEGGPLRLVFHSLDPTEYEFPKRAVRCALPQVGSIGVPNLEPNIVECEIPLEKGEIFHVYCENRFPAGTFPDHGVNRPEINRIVKEGKESTEPTIRFERMVVEGPVGPLPSQRRFLKNQQPVADERYLCSILLPFAERAFRRPLREGEKGDLMTSVLEHLEVAPGPEFALHYGIRRVLCSPQFLYREPESGVLDDYALASRMSYFLWSTMPDEELLELAAEGRLSEPNALQDQVIRMIADPRCSSFVKHFTGQWLGNRKAATTMICDNRYQWSELVRYGFLRSTEMFFEEILRKNLTIRTFIDSDFTFANDPMRLVWGFDVGRPMDKLEADQRQSTVWPEPTRLEFTSLCPEAPPGVATRGGVLGLSSVLMATGDGVESSPIMRGVWILENLFGQPPPPPPSDNPAHQNDTSQASTVREILAAHQQAESCAICHRKIDPLGLAMENYDAMGGWRVAYIAQQSENEETTRSVTGGHINPRSVLLDGNPLDDPGSIKTYLLERPELFTRCLTAKLFEYGTGRELSSGDEAVVDEIVNAEPADGYGFQDLLVKVINSRVFQTK